MGTDDRQKTHGAHVRLEGQGGPREGKQGAPRECMPAEEGPKLPQPQRPAAPAWTPSGSGSKWGRDSAAL